MRVRTYALQTVGVKSLWNLALELMSQRLLQQPEIMQRIIISLLYSIECQR